MVGDIDWAYNEFTGELLAIKDLTRNMRTSKLRLSAGLRVSGRRIPKPGMNRFLLRTCFITQITVSLSTS